MARTKSLPRRNYRRYKRRYTKRKRGSSVPKIVKRTVKAMIYKEKESKCICNNIFSLNNISETIPDYVSQVLYQDLVPGVTDRGRIGNTVNATGIRVNYVYKYQFPNTGDLYSTEPLTLHMFIVKCKNTWQLPASHWFKSLDRGAGDPYVALERESIDDGRRVLNTDYYTVVKHKAVTLQPSDDRPTRQATGYFTCSLKRQQLKFDSNQTTGNGIADINHIYMFYAYVYSGSGLQINTPIQYGARFAVYQYFKDA